MDKREELRHYIKAVAHTSDETLIAYYAGRLEETERERVQSHLEQCARCAAAFKNIREFLEPAGGGEGSIADEEVRHELQGFWQRMEAGPAPDAPPLLPERSALWTGRRPAWLALAAGLIVCVLAGGWLWTWQRYRSQQAHWQTQMIAARQNLETLQAEIQQLRTEQQRTQATMAQLSQRIQALVSPKLDVPIALVHSMGPTRQPDERPVYAPVPVPPGAPFVTLILYQANKTEYPRYGVELRDKRNALIWNASGLHRDATLDAYTLNFPAELILPAQAASPRDYVLVVYGEGEGRRRVVDRYFLRFVPKP